MYYSVRVQPLELFVHVSVYTFLLDSITDKADWTATASSAYEQGRLPSLIIDGDAAGDHFPTGSAPHSWVQIDMGQEKWVKGGRMVSRSTVRQMYTEVFIIRLNTDTY